MIFGSTAPCIAGARHLPTDNRRCKVSELEVDGPLSIYKEKKRRKFPISSDTHIFKNDHVVFFLTQR